MCYLPIMDEALVSISTPPQKGGGPSRPTVGTQDKGCSPWHSSQKPGPRLWQWLWKLQPQSREQRGAGGPGAGVGGGRSDVQPSSHTQVKSGGPLHTP